MADILSSDSKLVNMSINFIINQAKRLYNQKNIKRLKELRMLKIIQDLILQLVWGDDWEKKKPARGADDTTNKNPGSPKPTR